MRRQLEKFLITDVLNFKQNVIRLITGLKKYVSVFVTEKNSIKNLYIQRL